MSKFSGLWNIRSRETVESHDFCVDTDSGDPRCVLVSCSCGWQRGTMESSKEAMMELIESHLRQIPNG